MTKEQIELMGYQSVKQVHNKWCGIKSDVINGETYLCVGIDESGIELRYAFFRYLSAYSSFMHFDSIHTHPVGNWFYVTKKDGKEIINPNYKKEYYVK